MADSEILPGHLVAGRYRLIAEIGHGGMGRVWEARDTMLDRTVAVKEVMLPALPPQQQALRLKQAEREGRNAAALAGHPHIVSIYDVVVDSGAPWIVMQLVKGRSMYSALYGAAGLSDPSGPSEGETASTPLKRARVREIATAMLDALHHLHGARIIHRDIKPHNILLADDGGILLTDFGIAKSETDATVTVSGSVMGTMAYLAPERAEGEPGTAASDFFSLGVTLFEAVEGYSPFERKGSVTGTLTAILTKPLPPMKRAGDLGPLISALTLKRPGQRPTYPQALALLNGDKPDGWTMPDEGDAAITEETSASGSARAAKAVKTKPGNAKPPWQSVTLTKSAGLPRPPLITTPPPPPPQPARASRTSSDNGWVGGLLGVLAIAGIIAYNVSRNHHASQPASSSHPTFPVFSSAPVTLPPAPAPTTTLNMYVGCDDAFKAVNANTAAMNNANAMSDDAASRDAYAQGYETESVALNSAAAEANDPAVRAAVQAEATLAAELSQSASQLADDYRNNADPSSQVTDLTADKSLLDQETASYQAMLHACQNAAHGG